MTLHQRPDAVQADQQTAEKSNETQKPRFSHRKRGASAGIIYAETINGAVHCVVRDMSVTGARLLVKESKLVKKSNGKLGLPTDFTLNLRLDRVAVNCRIVWQEGDEVGVRFTSAPRVLARTLR